MEGETTYTITIYHKDTENETFNRCTQVEAYEHRLTFLDHNNKTHEFYGVQSHIAQD